MKKLILIFLVLPLSMVGQTTIKGIVSDNEGNPVPYANIYLKNTYDGTSSDINGNFEFSTSEKGSLVFGASCIGYKSFEQEITIKQENVNINPVLEIEINELDMVVITAGAFEASDEKKAVVLKPIDIVTTAGSQGDIYGAIQKLPGTQIIGEREGLFVRGGDASETKTIIDNLVVQNPYYSPVPDVPQRSRFYPFLFDGTMFSSGGYSAIYGQALSSALVLKTLDIADTTNTSFGINLVGANASHTQKWNNGSIAIGGNYTNTKPYFQINNTNTEWDLEPIAYSGEIIFRQKLTKTGMLKLHTTYDTSEESLFYPGTDYVDQKKKFEQHNNNYYINSTYRDIFSENWSYYLGTSYSKDNDDINNGGIGIESVEEMAQAKVILTRHFQTYNNVKFGGEVQNLFVNEVYDTLNGKVDETYKASFLETNYFITKKLAARVGVRYEHSSIINKSNVAPRISLAYKTGKESQISLAFGHFYQKPENVYLYQTTNLEFEKANHYIFNYQWLGEDRTFRIELYDKEYKDLVKNTDNQSIWLNNSGDGYARGVDIFWRDKKTIPFSDFWISYSFIDTKRKYRDFPVSATPTFVSKHTMNFVYKYWISAITTSVSLTYSFASGRPYYNPNDNIDFHSQLTPNYHNISLSMSKLTSIFGHFTVVYASLDNVLNRENVFGYRFIDEGNGNYTRINVRPAGLRTFFIGAFISIQ